MGNITSTAAAPRDSRRRHWVSDESAVSCQRCGDRFTLLTRRHHCRSCGQLFCGGCSSFWAACPAQGYPDAVRVCHDCFVRPMLRRDAPPQPPQSQQRSTSSMDTLRDVGDNLLRRGNVLEEVFGSEHSQVLRQLPSEMRGAIFLALLEHAIRERAAGRPRGATAAQIKAHVRQATGTGGVEADDCCAVCQELLLNSCDENSGAATAATLPRGVAQLPCRHAFHFVCIKPWLEHKNECPLCKVALPATTA